MRRYLASCLTLLLLLTGLVSAQENPVNNTNAGSRTTATNANRRPRAPVFRATKEQVTQAQTLLKQRNLYTGETSGKLDPATRAALKKYQEAENLRVTGTLNRATLEKMGIELTERQRAMR